MPSVLLLLQYSRFLCDRWRSKWTAVHVINYKYYLRSSTSPFFFTSVQFSSRWCLCAQKSLYALYPVSRTFPQRCRWNGSNVRLIDDDRLPSLHGRSSNNNNNEYLERLTHTGPKRLHVLYKYIFVKIQCIQHERKHTRMHTHRLAHVCMHARTHTHTDTQTHTHAHQLHIRAITSCVSGLSEQWDWRKGF